MRDSRTEGRGLDALRAASLLHSGTPQEVLARIAQGDPLRIAELCLRRVDERAVLTSLPRLVEKALARVAHDGRHFDARAPLDRWLEQAVDVAIDDLIEEDIEDDSLDAPLDGQDDPRYAFLAAALGVEAGVARRMCVVFHDLPELHRRVFHSVVLHRRSLDECAAQLGLEAGRARRVLKDTLLQLTTLGRRPRPTDDSEFTDEP